MPQIRDRSRVADPAHAAARRTSMPVCASARLGRDRRRRHRDRRRTLVAMLRARPRLRAHGEAPSEPRVPRRSSCSSSCACTGSCRPLAAGANEPMRSPPSGAALATATSRREIYDAALGAAARLTREGHEITLFELSDEALSPVAGTGTRSREARFLAGIDDATVPACARPSASRPTVGAAPSRSPRADRCSASSRSSGPSLEGHERSPARRARTPALARARERSADRGSAPQRERGAPRLARAPLERARPGRLRRHHDQLREPCRRAGARALGGGGHRGSGSPS